MNTLHTSLKNMAPIIAMLIVISACDSNDGALESAGRSVDQTATDMGNKLEDACEDAKEGMNVKDTRC